MVLDADFEPDKNVLKKLVSKAVETGADLVQGHQRHRKGSDTMFGAVYRAGMAGSIVMMKGRRLLDMFPIFTGSVGLIRTRVAKEIGFLEGSISEDLRFTMDYVERFKELRYEAVEDAYADGSVPRDQKSFFKQQIRWSTGTLREFMNKASSILFDSKITLHLKAGFVLQGLMFAQGLAVYTNLMTPYAYYLVSDSAIRPLWMLGMFVWLIGIQSLILSGGVVERFDLRRLTKVGISLFLFIYYSAFIHMVGTLKALLGLQHRWVVTPKRGSHAGRYRI